MAGPMSTGLRRSRTDKLQAGNETEYPHPTGYLHCSLSYRIRAHLPESRSAPEVSDRIFDFLQLLAM
jgi:hypothetical protein